MVAQNLRRVCLHGGACISSPANSRASRRGIVRLIARAGNLGEVIHEPSLGGVACAAHGDRLQLDTAASLRDPPEHRAAVRTTRQHLRNRLERNQIGDPN